MRVLLAAVAASLAFVPAPKPGPTGLEGVPVPSAPALANPGAVHLNQVIDGIKCQAHETVVFHIHAHLAIFVDGKQKQVPFGIGIGPPLQGLNAKPSPFVEAGSCFMWLHTHTADGIIHEEGPKKQTFTLGQFFAVWGIKLSSSQVGPAKGKVVALVNGKVWNGDPNAITLADHSLIQLDVGTPLVGEQKVPFAKLA